ncbi:Ltp family lipoprotein [Aeromicrobium sp. YIM 150415]|uniref:Ltp family lipoprotein n=1 Tax=Aeromicrobium sp. YIM 150415 TaxID=2803912 RepID=UPI001962727F|nr:Ltp family lipoprotein [Aeromicrobium sp. YIM 150415]MBM9464377.1 Ltp family lipoprotein [Aeromicrobium sp. YIM 150415]
MSDQKPNAGYYPAPDGSGQNWYWDGERWIDPAQTQPAMAGNAPEPERPWFKKKRIVIPGALVALIIFGAALSGGEGDADSPAASSTPAATETADAETVVAEEPEPEAEAEPEESMTAGQRNAVSSAEDYLRFTAFSRSGLITQLEFEGYTTEDATFAVDHLQPDWNEQAAKSAQEYLDFTSFSRVGLIEQLQFDGFSPEEATYGVDQAGL